MLRLRSALLFLCTVWGITQCIPGEIQNNCQTYWTAWRKHCYRYFGDEVSWTDAVNTCRLFSAPGPRGFADLASVHSQDEHDFLYSYWRSLRREDNRSYKPGMWIGLTDAAQNAVYEWSDGTPVNYTNFDERQESLSDYRWFLWDWTDSDWNPQGKWHDVSDHAGWYFQFMCKMDQA